VGLRLASILGATLASVATLSSAASAAFHEPVNASLNGDNGHSGFGDAIADFGGTPGVAWLESDPTASNPGALELHVAELSGATWRALGGAVSASSTTHQPALADIAGSPAVAWTESTAPATPAEGVRVDAYNGISWSALPGSLPSNPNDNTYLSGLAGTTAAGCSPGACPYVAFAEQNGSAFEIHVDTFNGVAWQAFGPTVNTGSTHTIDDVEIAQTSDMVWVSWWDQTTNAAHIARMAASQLPPVWDDRTLGTSGADGPPSMSVIGGVPYVTWSQTAAGASTVRLARWDTNTFTFVPVGGALGAAGKLATGPTITGVGAEPWVAYVQSESTGQPNDRVMVARFGGSNWSQVGGPLNHVLANSAGGPQITTAGGVPYVVWLEQDQNGPVFHSEVRVSGYVDPTCAGSSADVAHDQPAAVQLSCSDGSGDALRILSGTAHGALSAIDSSGSITYTPAAGYAGPDSFTYTGNDGVKDAPAATVTLSVNPAPEPVLSGLRLAGRFRSAHHGGSVVSKLPKSRRRHRIGTAISFTLSAAARVSFIVRAPRAAKGGFSVAGKSGVNTVLFSGRVAGHALKRGRYTLTATPAGGRAVTARFRIVG
jgi:hypothetical protein